MNIVPFEDTCRELVQRGVNFKYKPSSKILSVTVQYRRVIGHQNFAPHLEARGMIAAQDEGEYDNYPLHRDILVDSCMIEQYNIASRTIRLSDNRHLSVTDVINLLNRDLM